MQMCNMFFMIFVTIAVTCVGGHSTDSNTTESSTQLTNTSQSTENNTTNDTSTESPKSSAEKTALAISTPLACLAVIIAFTLVILRRRKKAKLRSQKYALVLKAMEETPRNRMILRVESFQKTEDHRYEEIDPVDKDDGAGQLDTSTNNFSKYLKYIQKDNVATVSDNEMLNYKQKESTPKVEIDVFINRNQKGDVPSASGLATRPTTEFGSTGFLSTLLNSQSKRIRRTNTAKGRKSTGYALRKVSSEWNNDATELGLENGTKSEENISRMDRLVYFELQSTDSISDTPDTPE